MDSNQHAIITSLTKLNDKVKYNLFTVIKNIIDLQKQGKFNLLNIQPRNEYFFQNYPSTDISPNNYFIIFELFQQFNLFNEIKKYITKTTKLTKISSIIDVHFRNKEENDNFRSYINTIIMINLIKKQLKNKSHQDIVNYGLLNKLSLINPNIVISLHLFELQNHQLNIIDFINNYNYQNNTFLTFNNDEYDKIYDIFFLFE